MDGGAQSAQFDEPGGLSYADGILYVADTNNHVIRSIDLAAGLVETLEFRNPAALVIDRAKLTILGGNTADGAVVNLDRQQVAAGEGTVRLRLTLAPNFKINPLVDSELVLDIGYGRQLCGRLDGYGYDCAGTLC